MVRNSLQVEKASDITAADKLIFPGVGSFGQAMRILTQKGLVEPLKDYIQVCAQCILSHATKALKPCGGRGGDLGLGGCECRPYAHTAWHRPSWRGPVDRCSLPALHEQPGMLAVAGRAGHAGPGQSQARLMAWPLSGGPCSAAEGLHARR